MGRFVAKPSRRALLRRLAAAGGAGWAWPAGAATPVATPAATPAPGPSPGDADGGVTAPATVLDDASDFGVAPGRALQFPRDHGAHRGTAIEWWYLTGWLAPESAVARPSRPVGAGMGPATADLAAVRHGFQVTFFRRRTAVAELDRGLSDGRFSPRHLLFAHAALTDLAPPSGQAAHRHAQRLARWGADPSLGAPLADTADLRVQVADWRLQRQGDGTLLTRFAAAEAGMALDLQCTPTQPLLLQGDQGHSRKGPQAAQASHYYTAPQLAAAGTVTLDGRRQSVVGRAWLDHEWSDALLDEQAVGWDWIGMNLLSGAALTAFQLRRADGTPLWTGGSWREAGQAVRDFGEAPLRFSARRWWVSPRTGGRYPVAWWLDTPVGRFGVAALADAQELDSRASTGTVYWEGLSELTDATGARIGLGYLEMTGRVGRLRIG